MPRAVASLLLLLTLAGCPTTPGQVDDDDGRDDDDTTAIDDDDDDSGDDDSGDDDTPPTDLDGDGVTVEDGDCDDLDPSRHPGAEEQCTGVDEDCDGEVDEGVPVTPLPPGDYGLAAGARFEGLMDGFSFGGSMHAIGDTDGDGADDLLITSPGNANLLFLAPFCLRGYAPSEAVATFESGEVGGVGSSYLGDVNRDGLDDTRVEGSVFFAPFSGTYRPGDGDLILDWGMATSMQAADLDGDGDMDLVAGHYGRNEAVFLPGPLLGPLLDTTNAATFTGPGPILPHWFGWSLTTLVDQGTATTVVSDPHNQRVYLIEGLPAPGTYTPSVELPVGDLFQPPDYDIGLALFSDGVNRLCVGGTDTSAFGPEAVCGTLDDLLAGTVTEWFGPPLNDASRWLAVTPDLWAAGGPTTAVNGAAYAGRVEVRGPNGNWTFSYDSGAPSISFGKGIALLADRPRNITWLAVTAPNENLGKPGGAEGAVYLFPLDAPPPPKRR